MLVWFIVLCPDMILLNAEAHSFAISVALCNSCNLLLKAVNSFANSDVVEFELCLVLLPSDWFSFCGKGAIGGSEVSWAQELCRN